MPRNNNRYPLNIVLVGMPGSGKTTVGVNLSRVVHKRFVDMDRLLITQFNMPIAQVFSTQGEPAFRDAESELCERLRSFRHCVISTGGGVLLRPTNRTLLRSCGKVVYLAPTVEMLWKRLRNDRQRPLLKTENPKATLDALLALRDPIYRDAAHLVIPITDQSPLEVAEMIQKQLIL